MRRPVPRLGSRSLFLSHLSPSNLDSRVRGLCRLLGAALALAALSSAPVAAQVRLSQVFGGGGNSGSSWDADFVELYNAGAPQSLAGWSVQYASAGGSSWQVTPLPALVLGSGEYLLVRQSGGAALPAPHSLSLPPAEAVGSVTLSATDGKLALCDSVSPLGGSAPVSAQIVDFVGYGTLASWNEPGAPFSAERNAPSPSNGTAIVRLDCGAGDFGDSHLDWAVALPQPRNRTVAPNAGLTAGVMVQPCFLEPGATARILCQPYACDTSAASASASISVDLSAIGGVSAASLHDDGTGGDQVAGDGLYTLDVQVAPGTPTGTLHLPVTLVDGPRSGGALASLNVLGVSAPDHDNCAGALQLAGPYTTALQYSGSFAAATAEFNAVLSASSANPGSMSSRRGVWFALTGSGSRLTVDTCASPLLGGTSIPDTVLMVFGGSCDGLTVLAANDDAPSLCGAGSGTERRSRVSWCTLPGEIYYVWLAPFAIGPQGFGYTLTVSDDGVPCGGATPLGSCPPPGSGQPEGEPGFGPATDDGCDSSPERFFDAAPALPAQLLRGTARSFGTQRDHDWYRFQAASSDLLHATLTAQFAGQLELRQLSASGGCAGQSLLGSSPVAARCAPTSLVATLTAGQWYAVRVVPVNHQPSGAVVSTFGGIAPGAFSYHYLLELELGGPPTNDLCAAAIQLEFGVPLAGSTNLLAGSEAAPACDPTGRDVWYSVFLATPGTLSLDTCGSAIDTALALYDACGGALIACNDDCGGTPCGAGGACLTQPGLAAGTYFVRVSDKGAPGGFVVTANFAHVNDDCAGALPLAVPSAVAGTTVAALPESGLPVCSGPLGSQTFDSTSPALWYSLTLPGTAGIDDRTVILDTLTASFDTKLSVFEGACGALSCITANDDIESGFRSKVAFHATAGVSYLVLVHGYGNNAGSFVLDVAAELPAPNDDCAAAQLLGWSAGSLGGSLAGATGEPNTYSATSLASCAGPFTAFDVWYRFDAFCNSILDLRTCGPEDTVLSVHSSCPDANVSNELIGGCNDDGPPGCAPGSSLSVFVVDGGSYWIRVAGREGALPGGGFTLQWSVPDGDGDGAPDCLEKCPYDPLKTAPGVCGCGIPDTDSDGDGAADCIDGCPNDPLKIAPGVCGCDVSDVDSDGDGTPNCIDGCPNDPLKIAPGVCGCDVSDVDSDGDGTPNCIDGCPNDPLKIAPGVCGCDVSDVDSDGDGTPDCIDGCPNDPLKTTPGVCGCGVPDEDVDGDGVVDCDDNCTALPNPSQADCDLDGVGDACEIFAGALDTDLDGVPDECELGMVLSFCTAGTSSHGCVPALSASGTPSASASSGFVISCSSLEGQKQALLFYGVSGLAATPWGQGSTSYKCVASPIQRISAAFTGGAPGQCNGQYSVDLLAWTSANPAALGMPLAAGRVFHAQVWYRDPPAPKTTNLSDALQFTLTP